MDGDDKFIIEGLGGKRTLTGEIKVSGSKNDTLPAMAATLLYQNAVTLTNVPEISDIRSMKALLEKLGAKVEEGGRGRLRVTAGGKIGSVFDTDIAKHFRGSIILLGPVLARTGQAIFPHPGGCVIGERPIDLFLSGLEKLGATVQENGKTYLLRAPRGLRGGEIFFKHQSVTATETLMMAAVLAKGKTVLKNSAPEPEVIALGEFLIKTGAKIKGLGTSTIEITGRAGKLLSAKNPSRAIIPDRIEAGSFVILGALVGQNLKISHLDPKHLESLLNLLTEMGVKLKVSSNAVTVLDRAEALKPLALRTHEFPGFPTDLQAPMAVLLTQASGRSTIFETIFEGRLGYLETLKMMGAQATVYNPHQASIEGPTPLHREEVTSPDLRAGLAYILAGAVASGRTVVHNSHYVERGYEKIETKLQAVGLKIEKK